MNEDDVTVALQFNDCINAGDLGGLSALMTDDHEFIDSANASVKGKAPAEAAWRGFFEAFPDYRNQFSRTHLTGGTVTIEGRSVCSFEPLNDPALWTAIVRDGKVAQWRVYDDTPQNRARLALA